jgi:type IV pilus assembly protein PilA
MELIMKKLNLNQDSGFTLVELMVVVAIVGILSAVAIPNFKKYQAKSKTSEAKLALSGIYSAETSLQADYDYFGSCLNYAGFSPTPLYYAVGFNAANNTTNGAIRTNGGTLCTNADTFVWPATKSVGGQTETTVSAGTVANTGDSFTAQAEGHISADVAAAVNSVWTINEDKALVEGTQGY